MVELNLTAVLAGLALADLALYRVAARVFLPAHPQGWPDRFLVFLAHYVHEFTGVIALVVLSMGLLRALRQRDLLPRSVRAAAVVISVGLVALGATGVILREVSERTLMNLATSQAFLAWFLALGAMRAGGPRGPRLGIVLFALPCVLETLSGLAARLGLVSQLPSHLARIGELVALGAAIFSPWLFARHAQGGGRKFAAGAGALVLVAGLTVAFARRFDLIHTVTLYGFHLDLPSPDSRAGFAYATLTVAAAAGIAFSTVLCLATTGAIRLWGLGLVLLAASGHKMLAPAQITAATCGLLALALGVAYRERPITAQAA